MQRGLQKRYFSLPRSAKTALPWLDGSGPRESVPSKESPLAPIMLVPLPGLQTGVGGGHLKPFPSPS